MPVPTQNEQRMRSLSSRLKLRQLTLLREIGEQLVLTRVAEHLGLTQPAVTKALREIEDIFMTPLFKRLGKGLRPTGAGIVALEYTKHALADLDATSRALTAIDAGLLGRVRVGILPDTPSSLVASLLGYFRAQPSRIAVLIREGDTTELTDALSARELDCVLARAHHRHIEGIEQHTILHQHPCLLVSAAGKRLSKSKPDLSQLSKMDWIMQPPGSTGRLTVDAIFVAAGMAPPTPFMETHSIKSIEEALRQELSAVCILAYDVSVELVSRGACWSVPIGLNWNLPPLTFFASRESISYESIQGLRAALQESATGLDAKARVMSVSH